MLKKKRHKNRGRKNDIEVVLKRERKMCERSERPSSAQAFLCNLIVFPQCPYLKDQESKDTKGRLLNKIKEMPGP